MEKGKRKVEAFWAKRGENSLKQWAKARSPLRVIWNFIWIWLAKYCPSLAVKRSLYRMVGISVGRDASIGLGVTFDIFFPELIEVGANSIIGYDSLILTHEFLVEKARKGRVSIGKDVLLGSRVIVLPGIRIGDGARVSSYSLVNRDVRPGEFVGGIPIRQLRARERR